MSNKLPADFDAERYRAANPDVALSGIDPKQHYLFFGALMGRSHKRASAGFNSTAQEAADSGSDTGPIIDRPDDFDTQDMIPIPIPDQAGAHAAPMLEVGALAMGSFASAEERYRICAPLTAYSQLFDLNASGLPALNGSELCGARVFKKGDARVENAWFADRMKLRLIIKGGSGAVSTISGSVLSAYQAEPDEPGNLKLAGQAIQLPAGGPIFHDIELVHPLMPIVLDLRGPDGMTRGVGLLPFPSLLPGGLHWAEQVALQNEPNPMDSFWALSEALLSERLRDAGSLQRSVTDVAIINDSARSESPYSSELDEWLAAVFGLGLRVDEADGFRLVIPRDCVPTISVLASRRLNFSAAQSAGSFLVADATTFRPRWSVVLAADTPPDAGVPSLVPATGATAADSDEIVPVHLAIVFRGDDQQAEAARSPAKLIDAVTFPVTVVLDASEPARTEAMLHDLRAVLGKDGFELRIRHLSGDEPMRGALDRFCGPDRWTELSPDADLRKIAREARHEYLLTVSDRVSLHDPSTLPSLCGILQTDERVASASCILLREIVANDHSVLETATGGLFPSHISFASSPRLAFMEPDVFLALPEMTYPVAANRLLMTVWRTRVVAELAGISSPASGMAAEIRLGLDILDAGYRNLCTTRCQATLSGSYRRQEIVDPVGTTYLQPGRWADVLSRVTLLRELL